MTTQELTAYIAILIQNYNNTAFTSAENKEQVTTLFFSLLDSALSKLNTQQTEKECFVVLLDEKMVLKECTPLEDLEQPVFESEEDYNEFYAEKEPYYVW
jgi:hypothetical protein